LGDIVHDTVEPFLHGQIRTELYTSRRCLKGSLNEIVSAMSVFRIEGGPIKKQLIETDFLLPSVE